MNNIGEKIREERLRLGLTQEDFARACKVGRRAQSAYEAGERVPDLTYLKFAIDAGADQQYILTGVRRETSVTADHFKDRFIRALCEILQIDGDPIDEAFHALGEAVSVDGGRHLSSYELNRLAESLLRHSKRLNSTEVQLELDAEALTDIIRNIEELLKHGRDAVPPYAKALAVVRLYRESAAMGRIDDESLRQIVAMLVRAYEAR